MTASHAPERYTEDSSAFVDSRSAGRDGLVARTRDRAGGASNGQSGYSRGQGEAGHPLRPDLEASRHGASRCHAQERHRCVADLQSGGQPRSDAVRDRWRMGWRPKRVYLLRPWRRQAREGLHRVPSVADQTIPASYDEHIYYGYTPEGIRPHLRRVMEERDPQRIGINVSPTLPMGTDWLSKRSERWTSGARRGKPSTSYRRGSGFWRSPERSSSSYSS